MKKILILPMMASVLSCSKTFNSPAKDDLPAKASVNSSATTNSSVNSNGSLYNSNETVDYDSRVYNDCTSEWVHLTGKVKYNIKENFADNKYMLVYIINFENVKGVGETSGTRYAGGGANPSSLNTFFDKPVTEGTNIYKVRFTAAGGGQLIYTQNSHYTMNAEGTVTVDFNDYGDTCK